MRQPKRCLAPNAAKKLLGSSAVPPLSSGPASGLVCARTRVGDGCLAPSRASGHGVAGPDAGAAARAPHLVPGWRAHRQQHAGLRALVPPGAAPPPEAKPVSFGRGRGLGEGWAGPGRWGGGASGDRVRVKTGPVEGAEGQDWGPCWDWIRGGKWGSFWRKDGVGPAKKPGMYASPTCLLSPLPAALRCLSCFSTPPETGILQHC